MSITRSALWASGLTGAAPPHSCLIAHLLEPHDPIQGVFTMWPQLPRKTYASLSTRIRTQISATHTREDLAFAVEQFKYVRQQLS